MNNYRIILLISVPDHHILAEITNSTRSESLRIESYLAVPLINLPSLWQPEYLNIVPLKTKHQLNIAQN